jgi:RNA polymerase sigma-70 factor (ECF subfamily)
MNERKFNRLFKKYGHSRDAVNEIYTYYYPRIVIHINRRYRGKVDGRDIAHQTFIELFRVIVMERIRYPTGFIYTIANHIALEVLRKDKKRTAAEKAAAVPETENLQEVQTEVFEKLNPQEKEVIYLHYWEGYSFKEIAELLKLKYTAVKYLHKTAKAVLEKQIIKERKNERFKN